MSNVERYAVVGTGGRSVMFIDAMTDTYRADASLVAFCDTSRTRMMWHNRRIDHRHGAAPVPMYQATAFDQMVYEQRPDVVIVTSVDATHHQYVIRAMELGCDAVCEKPLTTTAKHAKAVIDTVDRTGRKLTVTFNVRYAPYATAIKQLIQQGVIGQPTAVDYRYALNTRHGADYFRRWHAIRVNSGGLLVHKSTHHFDLVNWWLDDRPVSVAAMGDLMFYGQKNAEARGEHYDYARYTGHAAARNDPFAIDLDHDDDELSNPIGCLYRDAEPETGYIRDRNVFGDHIDIEDTIGVLVRYHRGAILNYSLLTYAQREGFDIAITGTAGRLEFTAKLDDHIRPGPHDSEPSRPEAGPAQALIVRPMFKPAYRVEIPKAQGGHGGADPQLLDQLFAANPKPDPYARMASHIDGCSSLLVSISANESIRLGQTIRCDDLLPLPNLAGREGT